MKAPSADTHAFTFGPFRVEPDANRLLRDGTILLTGKPVDTLVVLLQHRDRAVEKDELLSLVWPDAFVSEDSLTHSISMIRKALGEDSSQPQYIATIPRRGYRFIGTLTEADPVEADDHDLEGVESVEPPPPVVEPPAAASGPQPRWLALAVAVVSLAAVLLLVDRTGDPSNAMPAARAIRFTQQAPAGTTLASGGIVSPDGTYLAFVARAAGDGKSHLWVRPLDGATARQLPGTDGAFRPFWSHDSQSLAFFADGRLKRVGIGGTAPLTVAAVGYRPSGGTWSSTGVILFADRQSPIFMVQDSGGASVRALTALDESRKEVAHYAPQFLPDGRHFLYFVDSANPADSGTYVGSLDSPDRTRVLDETASAVTFDAPNHLLFIREKVLMAQQFDVGTRRLLGMPVALRDDISTTGEQLSAAEGILAFGGDTATEHLMWFDRSGGRLGALETSTNLHNPVFSPDDRQLLADGGGVWLVDLEGGAPTRVANGNLPIWSADGQAILFTDRRGTDAADIVVRPVSGRPEDGRPLVRGREMKLSGDWSDDGRHFVYVASSPTTRLDIWVLGTGNQEPQPFLQTSSNEMHPRISPDGQWLAYASDETGRWEVFVQAFPRGGAKRAISVAGGVEPQWTKDGRELVYLSPDGTLVGVEVSTGPEFVAGRAKPLFRVALNGDVTRYRNHYAVTSDGQRFLVNIADETTRDPISVVVNWDALIAR